MADESLNMKGSLAMDSEPKAWVICICAVCAMVASVAWAIAWYEVSSARDAFEAGYEKQSIVGQSGTYWVKSRAEK